MTIRIGNDNVSKLYVGSSPVNRVYIGSNLVWQASEPGEYSSLVQAVVSLMMEYSKTEFDITDGFEIEVREVGSGTSDVIDVGLNFSYTQLGLSPSTDYEARVRMYESEQYSNWTNWVQVSTIAIGSYDDFSTLNYGDDPLDTTWDVHFNSPLNSEIVDYHSPVHDRVWRLEFSGSTLNYVFEWLGVELLNSEVLMLVRRQDIRYGVAPLQRMHEDGTTLKYLYGGFRNHNDATDIRLAYWENQTQVSDTVIAHGLPFRDRSWSYIRTRVDGSNMYTKVWDVYKEEPTNWTLTSTTIGGNINVAGHFGFYYRTPASVLLVAYISTSSDESPAYTMNLLDHFIDADFEDGERPNMLWPEASLYRKYDYGDSAGETAISGNRSLYINDSQGITSVNLLHSFTELYFEFKFKLLSRTTSQDHRTFFRLRQNIGSWNTMAFYVHATNDKIYTITRDQTKDTGVTVAVDDVFVIRGHILNQNGLYTSNVSIKRNDENFVDSQDTVSGSSYIMDQMLFYGYSTEHMAFDDVKISHKSFF